MKPRYIETTIPSYLTARPSRDVIAIAHQSITKHWWEKRRTLFDGFISPVVLEEARQGDPEAARRRLEVLAGLPLLVATDLVEQVTQVYVSELELPAKSIHDAAHLAFACAYEVDYLLTCNCAHIANAEVRRKLHALNMEHGWYTPIICTPEKLMGPEDYDDEL